MKTISQQKSWSEAEEALAAGGFANHASWNANGPQSDPGYVGPTALAAHEGTFVVVTDNGIVIHDWRPSPAEMASKEWQIVEIAAGAVKSADQGRLVTQALPIIHHDQKDPRSPIPGAGPRPTTGSQ